MGLAKKNPTSLKYLLLFLSKLAEGLSTWLSSKQVCNICQSCLRFFGSSTQGGFILEGGDYSLFWN